MFAATVKVTVGRGYRMFILLDRALNKGCSCIKLIALEWGNSSLSDCPRPVMGPSPVCVLAMDQSSQGDKSLIEDFWKNMFQSQF